MGFETMVMTFLEALTEPVYWAGFLAAGILIGNIRWALAAGFGWAVLIEAGGWLIYPSDSIRLFMLGPPLAALLATALAWSAKKLIRKTLISRNN